MTLIIRYSHAPRATHHGFDARPALGIAEAEIEMISPEVLAKRAEHAATPLASFASRRVRTIAFAERSVKLMPLASLGAGERRMPDT